MSALDECLKPLEERIALRVLIAAWRRHAHPSLAAAIATRSVPLARTHDWDLDRFDVGTLPQVLAWLVDSGPTSALLETVLQRLEPFLPDPRALAPLEALAAKDTPARAKASELAQLCRLTPSSLSDAEVVAVVRSAVESELQRDARLADLVAEGSPERRAVLADWFADRGEPIGEFVGLQLAGGPPGDRERALWAQHGIGWIRLFLGDELAALGPGEGSGAVVRERARFERGVPVAVTVQHLPADPSPGWGHVRELDCRDTPDWARAELLVRLPTAARRLETLRADWGVVRDLTLRGPWPALRRLHVSRAGAAAWGALVKGLSAFPQLAWLRLERSSLAERGLTTALGALRGRRLSLELALTPEWGTSAELRLEFPSASGTFSTNLEALPKSWAKLLGAVTAVVGPLRLESKLEVPVELRAFFAK